MTGPEHYREAERLLRESVSAPVVPGYGRLIVTPAEADAVARAQVHATLAQVALHATRLDLTRDDDEAWREVIGGGAA